MARARRPEIAQLVARSLAWPEDDPEPPPADLKLLITLSMLPRPKRMTRSQKRVLAKVEPFCESARLGIGAATDIRGSDHVFRVLGDWAIGAAVELDHDPAHMAQLVEYYRPQPPLN